MSMIISNIHIAAAVLSLAAGPLIFLKPKGSRLHRYAGGIYVLAMLMTAWSGFFIFNFDEGRFGPFHIFSLVTTFTIVRGMMAISRFIRTREPEAIFQHYFFMCYSYMGLLMAASNQLQRALPVPWTSATQYWVAMISSWIIIWWVSRWFIERRIFPGIRDRFSSLKSA